MFLRLQNVILEMIARGEPLAETARRLCLEAEKLAPGCICSILTVDQAGALHPLAGPSLPAHYSAALDEVIVGPNCGSCGTAAYRGEPVTVVDIETDPLWADYKALALPIGLRACWSSPIFGRNGRVIATFAFYYGARRGPSATEKRIVAACLNLCAVALERDETERENHRLAYFDSLTGLANRASFNAAMTQAQLRTPGSFALLLIDVDRLKLVNDTLGHAGGDDLIREVGARIAASVAPYSAYRVGGDEFATIIAGEGAGAQIETVASRILEANKLPAICGGHALQPTVTIGAASFDEAPTTVEELRQNADFALYHAKEKGRGGVVRFSRGLGTTITQRFHAISSVCAALDEDRLEAHYQPVVRLDTREIVGVEALCRIRGREGEVSPASSFQQAMTDATTAARITERMLTAVAGDVRRWLDAGIPFQHVGINVTVGDFQRGDLEERIATIFERSGVPLRHVILEVTESVYMGDADLLVAEAVKALRARGLLVALDDFGTGYASLTHLLTFPVDIIKIDRSFVAGLCPGAASAAIVEGLIEIARKLGMRIVAEGVETERQAKELQALGCRLGQGYLYAPPCGFEEATSLLKRLSQPARRTEKAQSAA
jgi:diguanylate cyclase (GGDEF)-like protein